MSAWQVRVFYGPDGSAANRACPHGSHKTMLAALKCARDERAKGLALYLRFRLASGEPWYALTATEENKAARQHGIRNWISAASQE